MKLIKPAQTQPKKRQPKHTPAPPRAVLGLLSPQDLRATMRVQEEAHRIQRDIDSRPEEQEMGRDLKL